jgi:hypothetical protein
MELAVGGIQVAVVVTLSKGHDLHYVWHQVTPFG